MPDDAEDRTEMARTIWSQDYVNHYTRLHSYAWRLAGDGDAAGDIAQNAICKILKLVPNPDSVGDRLNYLLRSVHNAAMDWLKEKNRHKTISLDDPDNKEVNAMPAPDRDADADAEMEKRRLVMSGMLRRLNERERNVFTLYLEGFDCSEIATRLSTDRRVISYELNAVRAKVRYWIQQRLQEP